MKILHAAFATLLITGSMFLQPAHAQSTPQEYRTSCTDARVEDRTVCRERQWRAYIRSHGQPMAPLQSQVRTRSWLRA